MKHPAAKSTLALLAALLAAGAISLAAGQGAAPKASPPVLVTSCGQSQGPAMLNVILRRVGVAYDINTLATPQDLKTKPYKTLIVTMGSSLKGMGAAGISIDDELKRIGELIDAAHKAKITVIGVPDVPGSAARLFEAVARADVNIDMIVQNVSAVATGVTDISFTLPMASVEEARAAIEADRSLIGYTELVSDDAIGKISLIGAGMRSNSGVSARFFAALRDAGVNIEMISTSDIRISVVTRAESLDTAVRAVHTAFGLDSLQGEAIIYGGSGR